MCPSLLSTAQFENTLAMLDPSPGNPGRFMTPALRHVELISFISFETRLPRHEGSTTRTAGDKGC